MLLVLVFELFIYLFWVKKVHCHFLHKSKVKKEKEERKQREKDQQESITQDNEIRWNKMCDRERERRERVGGQLLKFHTAMWNILTTLAAS